MRIKIVISSVLALAMIAVVQAQQGRGMGGGGGTSIATLVVDKAVQEDLKMADDQVTKVKDWSKEFGAKRMEIMKEKGVEFGGGNKGGGKGAFTPPTPEMQEKIAAANVEINKVALKELGDVLKKEQVERLKQIERQAVGINAFVDPEVVSTLKLEDSQKTSIKGLTGDFTKDSRDIRQEAGLGGGNKGGGKGGGFDPEKMAEMNKKIQKVQKEYVAKAVDILNDEQKKTWKGLIGEPFDVTKLTPGGGFQRKKD